MRLWCFVMCSIVLLAATPCEAGEPARWELSLAHWSADYELGGAPSSATGREDSFILAGGVWRRGWGVRIENRGERFSLKPDITVGGSSIRAQLDSSSLDVRRKVLEGARGSWLAVGLGVQHLSFDAPLFDEQSTGGRVLLEGRLGLGERYSLRGEYVHYLGLEDLAGVDLEGFEYGIELSVGLTRHLDLIAGYRVQKLITTSDEPGEGRRRVRDTVDGVFLGVRVHW